MERNYYKIIRINGKPVPEHRYIMEQYLGRKLERNEVVHHKNRNRQDNRISNLQVMTVTEHLKLHAKDKKRKPRIWPIYPNLNAELARRDIKRSELAKYLKISAPTLVRKMHGDTEFTLEEAFKIYDLLNVDFPIEDLFSTEPKDELW